LLGAQKVATGCRQGFAHTGQNNLWISHNTSGQQENRFLRKTYSAGKIIKWRHIIMKNMIVLCLIPLFAISGVLLGNTKVTEDEAVTKACNALHISLDSCDVRKVHGGGVHWIVVVWDDSREICRKVLVNNMYKEHTPYVIDQPKVINYDRCR
jgi:hypothetical protein